MKMKTTNKIGINHLEKEWKQRWFQYILDHPNKNWNYCLLSSNPNILFDTIEANPGKPWKDKAKTYILFQSSIKQYFVTYVLYELITHCLHPNNFFKLYGLGHQA